MTRQIYMRKKEFSKQKIIKTYCYKVFKEMFTFLFLYFNSPFFSSLILNKYIYIMLIMSSLCISLHFFTKRNDREEKKSVKRKKRRNIHCNNSACRIAMIMKFSTRSRHYICLLCKRFQSLNIHAIFSRLIICLYICDV